MARIGSPTAITVYTARGSERGGGGQLSAAATVTATDNPATVLTMISATVMRRSRGSNSSPLRCCELILQTENLMTRLGLEPRTYGLKVRCSTN